MKNFKDNKFDVYDYVNETIIEQLGKVKNGDLNHLINSKLSLPYNPISKKKYISVNSVVLTIISEKNMFKYNAWATFKQIKNEGGKIQKGAKSEKVIFYNFIYFYKKNEISFEEYKKLKIELPTSKKLDLEKKSYLKYYNVFNFRYVEGLDHLIIEDKNINYKSFEPISECQNIVKQSNANILNEKVSTGCYNYTKDLIVMPYSKFYKDSIKYYSMLFHELSHWTGHKSRLDRVFSNKIKDYAFEELIAEFSAAYLSAFCGIKSELNNSAHYIDSWLKYLKSDKKYIFKAISKSQKSFEFLSSQTQ